MHPFPRLPLAPFLCIFPIFSFSEWLHFLSMPHAVSTHLVLICLHSKTGYFQTAWKLSTWNATLPGRYSAPSSASLPAHLHRRSRYQTRSFAGQRTLTWHGVAPAVSVPTLTAPPCLSSSRPSPQWLCLFMPATGAPKSSLIKAVSNLSPSDWPTVPWYVFSKLIDRKLCAYGMLCDALIRVFTVQWSNNGNTHTCLLQRLFVISCLAKICKIL